MNERVCRRSAVATNRAEFRKARREARKVLQLAVAYLGATGEHMRSFTGTIPAGVYGTAVRGCGDELTRYRLLTRLRWYREGDPVHFGRAVRLPA